ncbi:hypothetical protein JCM10908_005436 [Rhodotorula pacifica]|uniref:uncharacterized protein n=1 Tax=Rhodotorula pacifica TaxID=1495444 RepID=UPI00317D454B
MSVPTFTLSDGRKVPALAWGNGTGNAKKTAIESGVLAVKSGIRHIDTAQGYDNEEETGRSIDQAIKEVGVSASDIFLTTKISTEGGDPNAAGIELKDLRDSVKQSLARLGRQPDLLLVHNPFVPPKGKLVEFWKILEDLKDDGTITASLGVSNFRPQDFKELLPVCKYKPTVNQLEYHPYVLSHLDPVLKIMNEHSIRVASYGPMSPVLRHPSKTGGPIRPLLAKAAERLSKEHGVEVDEATVCLLWCRAKGAIAVTASANPKNIEKMAATQKLPDLTKEEVDEIEQTGRKVYFRAYDEHMCVDYPAPNLPQDL